MPRTRVSVIASTLAFGGAGNVMFEICSRLPHDRFELQLLYFREPGGIGERLRDRGLTTIANIQPSRWDPRALARLTRHLRSFSPDIMFAIDHHNALLWGGLASVVAGVPTRVLASHTTGRNDGRSTFRASDRFAMTFFDGVVALSDRHAEFLSSQEGVPAAKIEIIENGIDVTAFASRPGDLRGELGIASDAPVMAIVAALRPEKAHDAVLRAAQRLLPHHPHLRVLIAGDGPRRPDLEQLAIELNLDETVIFAGERRDIPAVLNTADVVVLPSHPAVETLPLAVMEAMAAGVPVVASAVGSVPDMIEAGENGFLIEPADVEQLSHNVDRLLRDAALRERIAAAARTTVASRYTAQRMAARYADYFERLANA